MIAFPVSEKKRLSQIPVLQLLANVGYEALIPGQALAFRQPRTISTLTLTPHKEQIAT